MAEPKSNVPLFIQVSSESAGAEKVDHWARLLAADLRQGNFVPVSASSTSGMPHAKGDPITIGAFALAVAPVLLPKLLDYLKDWSRRAQGAPATVTLRAEVDGQKLELVYSSDTAPSQETVLAYLNALKKNGM